VLENVEGNKWKVINRHLKDDSPGLDYRFVKLENARMNYLADWGTVVEGEDEGDGWVQITSKSAEILALGFCNLRIRHSRQKLERCPRLQRLAHLTAESDVKELASFVEQGRIAENAQHDALKAAKPSLQTGSRVQLAGLQERADLNAQRGTCRQ